MSLTIQLPAEIEQNLRNALGNLDQAGKEAMLVELYRQRKLNHYELSQALGFDRFETEDLLHKHNVTEDLPTLQDLEADGATLTRLLGPSR
jgi:hypothetical protein